MTISLQICVMRLIISILIQIMYTHTYLYIATYVCSYVGQLLQGLDKDWNESGINVLCFSMILHSYFYFNHYNIIASKFQDRLMNELIHTYYCYIATPCFLYT